MRTDAYLTALRAAMKVTFSAAFVSGCSARDGGKPVASTESDLGAAHRGAEGSAKPQAAASSDARPNCGHALASFKAEWEKFSVAYEAYEARAEQEARNAAAKGERPSSSPPTMPRPTPALMACCRAELSKDRTLGAHYVTCCNANRWASETLKEGGEDLDRACSPWGPPVPPPMWPLRENEVTGTA